MNKDSRKLNEEILIDIYDQNPEVVQKMSDDELQDEVNKLNKAKARERRNPNRFFVINGMPAPKEYQTKTSSKAGMWVVISLFIVLLVAFGMFLLIAFFANK